MPRRNLYLLWFLTLFCLLCYAQSDPLGRVLSQTLRRIQWRYLEEVEEEKLFEGAVNGMVNHLGKEYGDRYSMYVPPENVGEFEEEIDQEFGGIGISMSVDPKTGQLTVLSPIFGAPASLSGILANDRIVAIDGVPIKGFSSSNVKKNLRGKVGEPVVLRIQRPVPKRPVPKNGAAEGGIIKGGIVKGSASKAFKEFDVKLTRGIVKVDTVLGDTRDPDGSWNFMLDDDKKIGYLRISSFTNNTFDEIQLAIAQLQKEGMKGLIIDLRNNPGGYLDFTVKICDLFVDSGIIVTTRGRSQDLWHWFSDEEKPEKFATRDEFFATAEGTLDKNFPIAVLINDQSASAAEIFPACLQDHKRAKVIGERSFGKGTVQEVVPLGGGHGILKLTAASYWRPSGKNINRSKKFEKNGDWGVRPDPGFEVPIDLDTRKTILVTRHRRDVNYNEAFRIPDQWLESEHDEEPENESASSTSTDTDISAKDTKPVEGSAAENGSPKKKAKKKRLPLIDPSVPMIDVDPQLRKAVEWIEKEERKVEEGESV